MSIFTTATIDLDDQGLERLEVHVEVWWDGDLQVNAYGLHPTNGLTGLASNPFRTQKLREAVQDIIDSDEEILDQLARELADADRKVEGELMV